MPGAGNTLQTGGDSLKFEIKTVEVADNAVQTRIFIDGVDVTNRIKKFTLKKDGSPLELSLTILGDIDVSIGSFEMGNIKNIDSIQPYKNHNNPAIAIEIMKKLHTKENFDE